jgi:hypothetical protein
MFLPVPDPARVEHVQSTLNLDPLQAYRHEQSRLMAINALRREGRWPFPAGLLVYPSAAPAVREPALSVAELDALPQAAL